MSLPADEPSATATALKECRHGRMLYLRRDAYVGRSLDLYGEYSEAEADILLHLVGPGDVVVEAGANIGGHTVPLARRVGPQGMVMAFEPQRVLFQILCANLALNDLFNVQTVPAGLGEERGMLRVPLIDYAGEGNFGGVSLGEKGDPVQVLPLDDFGLLRLRMLKIDVEGMEAKVLAGARDTIARLRPLLYIENDRADKSPQLIGAVAAMGYRMWWHLPSLFNPDNFAGNPENVFGGIISINLLAVPNEVTSNIRGLPEVTGPDDTWQRAAAETRAAAR